ncbi:MAG: Zn-ribbon domain-containing OB-fold protein [Halobacteriota archaeon]|nr:Zn-ribbon domain-containing OB-fold protein [Halobacteriota archaeon]
MTVARFWRNISGRYNLEGTFCENCNSYYFPPRNICPTCRRDGKIRPHKFNGTGEVITKTVVHSSSSGFVNQVPYVLAIVRLDEGPRLTSQIICDPDEVDIGSRVRPVFRKIGEESEKGVIYYGTKFVPV